MASLSKLPSCLLLLHLHAHEMQYPSREVLCIFSPENHSGARGASQTPSMQNISLIHSPKCSSLLAPLLPGALIALRSKYPLYRRSRSPWRGTTDVMERRSTHWTPLSLKGVWNGDFAGWNEDSSWKAHPTTRPNRW